MSTKSYNHHKIIASCISHDFSAENCHVLVCIRFARVHTSHRMYMSVTDFNFTSQLQNLVKHFSSVKNRLILYGTMQVWGKIVT